MAVEWCEMTARVSEIDEAADALEQMIRRDMAFDREFIDQRALRNPPRPIIASSPMPREK